MFAPQKSAFEFTQPTAVVTKLAIDKSEGIQEISWPNEVIELARRIPTSLSALVLGVMGMSNESLAKLEEITSSLEDLKQFTDINNEKPIPDDLRGLRQAIHLALRVCSQCRALSQHNGSRAPNNLLFRTFLSEMIGVIMPEYFVLEQLKVATSRGRSAKMNFTGLSPTSRRASLLVLYDISGFESIFTSQVSECPRASSCAGSETSAPASVDSRNQTPDENQANNSDSDDAYNSGRSSSSAGSTRNSVIRKEMSAYLSMTYSVQTTGFNLDSDDIHAKQQDVAQPVVSESTSHAKNAYLLTEDQIGKPPSVAMICAGPMDELESIMLSALYQRTVWGIAEPLIGFSWDSTRATITTVFGWVDRPVDEDGCLPDVHLVYADGDAESRVFEMNDPISVMRLVEFIWNMREDLRRITIVLESAVPHVVQSMKEHRLMQWRADSASKVPNEKDLTREELFSLWIDRIQSSEDGASVFHEDSVMELRKGDLSTDEMSSAKKRAQAHHLARSHSCFEDDYEILAVPIEEIWLQDRRAHCTGLPSYEGFPGSDVIVLFHQYTRFYRPPGMDLFNDTPTDTVTLDTFEEIQRHGTAEGCDEILDDSIWNYLMHHMERISSLSASSRRKMEYKMKHNLMHCETRAEWESLMSILFRGSSDRNFELRTDCDRELNLPRNVASELVPFIDSDEETCYHKFMAYANIIYAQKQEWGRYKDSLAHDNLASSQEHRLSLIHRSLMIGNRMLLFESEFNKRHLWRSLQCDPTTSQVPCLGIMEMEIPSSNLQADTSRFDDHVSSIRCSDTNLSPSILASDLLNINGHAKTPHALLELPLLYYGFSGRTSSHPRQIPQTSMNLVRMNLVAGVTHLSSLGIIEFPLFGVAIEGSVGNIICAWCGPLKVERQTQSSIYILDKDTVQYDLATPIGAYNYATFLCMLANKHAPELAARLTKRCTGDSEISTKQWEENDWIRKDWTMAEQASWFKEQGYLDDDEY